MSEAYNKMIETSNIAMIDPVPMREWCKRPGNMDKDGNPVYFTEQHHKDQCDINKILKKYDRTGLITHVSKIEAKYGDLVGLDFKAMQDQVTKASSMFNDLPSEIRNRFNNNPAELLTFMEDANNRDEAIELGLIDPIWTPETDGLGEHIPEGGNIEQEEVIPATP